MDIKTDPTSSLQSTEATEKPTLLIVDDSRLMRHTLKKMLSNDFNLVEAVDGEDGWEKLLAEPRIQAVFSDLSMPNLDGYGLLDRIRKATEAHINTLPFIVITGKEGDDQSLLEEVRKNGAND
ncbi:MAG: response regulator, partial [Thiogranum sp.]|nr:response regulator [Thiogranum sp.]